MYTAAAIISLLLTQAALAQQVQSRSQLETILDDQILLEDFESLSLHSGSNFQVPNPLNQTTAADFTFSFDILESINYQSPTALFLYAAFFNGDDDVYLRAETALTITFDEPQIAFGFDLYASDATITIYTRDNSILDQFILPSNTFFGYQAPSQGIASITITDATTPYIGVNNVAYGATFLPCPADLNNDQSQDFLDISEFLSAYTNEDDLADYTDDGQFDFLDISAFLTAYTTACP